MFAFFPLESAARSRVSGSMQSLRRLKSEFVKKSAAAGEAASTSASSSTSTIGTSQF